MHNHTLERVTNIRHWNDRLFSVTTTRPPGLRFESGHYVSLGLAAQDQLQARPHSVASATRDPYLEFLSHATPADTLGSRLQALRVGDPILVGRQAGGTLRISDLRPGKRLYLLATGSGVAPFLSIIRDPKAYEAFDTVVLVHCAREVSGLAYRHYITQALAGQQDWRANGALRYVPTVTREPFERQGRITALIHSGELARELGLPPLNPEHDRVMVCGSKPVREALCAMLEGFGFRCRPEAGPPGDYVYERGAPAAARPAPAPPPPRRQAMPAGAAP
ncbi:Ferredoxin--NADP(+) reductase [plant metagenome]|uniref:ferredoxin--NADP(+) reductase n=1 Tax=plant metagenome TaxID=1297885 RepID=A0A484VFK6_9ZZZZ